MSAVVDSALVSSGASADLELIPLTAALPVDIAVVGDSLVATDATGAVGLTLPQADGAEVEQSDVNGETLVSLEDGSADFSTALLDEANGSFRALIRIDSPDAPTEYTFDTAIPVGGSLEHGQDGGISVRAADGNIIGNFAAPWAVDARGISVPTEYVIQGNSIIQRVQFTQSTAFPVVADPFWIPALFVVARLSAHVAARAAQRGISRSLIQQVVQNGKKTKGNGNTSVFTQGSGKNKIRVVVNNSNGTIITATKG